MKIFSSLALAAALTVLATPAPAMTNAGGAVELRIETDAGNSLPLYPVESHSNSRRLYAEAVKGSHYRIVVRNRLDRRVGLVVAVDGRNIISGKKSGLQNDERMYILDPYGTGEYSGWRTGDDRVNRFYFTSVADSYAAAFGDESAMGVIAVAVYPEQVRYEKPVGLLESVPKSAVPFAAAVPLPAPAADAAGGDGFRAAKHAGKAKSAGHAGTGYGREEYSPVITVSFTPEAAPREKIFMKYEWRESLCRKGIIPCGKRQENRFWEEDNGYAPPPPPHG